MSSNDWKPKDVGYVTAYLTVPDVDAMVEFYTKAFSFEQGEGMPGPEGKLVHASMKYNDTHVVMFGAENAFGSTRKAPSTTSQRAPVDLYLYHPDMEALTKQAVDAGAKLISEPTDQFWGDRISVVEDIAGYQWTLATKVGEFDASKIPDYE